MKPPSFVYYALDHWSGHIKIGRAWDPERRIRDYTVSNPAIELLAFERGGRRVERTRHRQFVPEWLRGEWFHASPRLMEWVELVAIMDCHPSVEQLAPLLNVPQPK